MLAKPIKSRIMAIWHGDLLTGTEIIGYFLPLDIIVSHSRDGELVARLIGMDGAKPLRGGSSRGQITALREAKRRLEDGINICFAVDGPRGPAEEVKSGIVLLASQTFVPVVPLAMTTDRAWKFKSWDQAFIPKPFATVRYIFGDPIVVQRGAGRDELEACRLDLQTSLKKLHLSGQK